MKLESSRNYISPYLAVTYGGCHLSPHKHYDIEIIYSRKGDVHFTIDRKNYVLHANQMIIIHSLATHSSVSEHSGVEILLLKIGSAFLRGSFSVFSAITFDNPVIDLSDDNNEWQKKTRHTLENIYNNLQTPGALSTLMIQSDLYRISSYILEMYQMTIAPESTQYNQYANEKKLEDVLNHVFNYYYEEITVEDAARISGYTKEYFCKIFKQFTGESFHQFLNRVRIEQSKFLITNTSMSITEIATTVGIKDDSTFRSIFKKFTNHSPTEYKKK